MQVPHEVEHVWQWFCQLSATRPPAMAGISAISFSEVKAWAEMTGSMPSYWEVSVLMRMDTAVRAASTSNAPISSDAPAAPIEASDGREVIGLMRSLAARKKG